MDPAYEDKHRRYQQQAAWTKDFQRSLLVNRITPPPWKVLEVGSGTGAVLSQQKEISSSAYTFFGIDCDFNALSYSQQLHDIPVINGYGEDLPFPENSFDLVECHYLLLWLRDPIAVLKEMRRLCKIDGTVAILAEPDYDARISFPDSISGATHAQTRALVQQGATANTGRHISFWMKKAGFAEIITGIHGVQWSGKAYQSFLQNELLQIQKDTGESVQSVDVPTQEIVLFVPTFYCYAQKSS